MSKLISQHDDEADRRLEQAPFVAFEFLSFIGYAESQRSFRGSEKD